MASSNRREWLFLRATLVNIIAPVIIIAQS
jgi:hypothetical protein